MQNKGRNIERKRRNTRWPSHRRVLVVLAYSHRVHCIINKLRVTSKTKSHAICKLGITHSSVVWKSTGGLCSLPRTWKRGQWCRNDRVRLLPRKASSFVVPFFFQLISFLPSLSRFPSFNPRGFLKKNSILSQEIRKKRRKRKRYRLD